jgi:hypothetical protein
VCNGRTHNGRQPPRGQGVCRFVCDSMIQEVIERIVHAWKKIPKSGVDCKKQFTSYTWYLRSAPIFFSLTNHYVLAPYAQLFAFFPRLGALYAPFMKSTPGWSHLQMFLQLIHYFLSKEWQKTNKSENGKFKWGLRVRASTHYAFFGRSFVFSCFISCLLFKDKYFLVFYSNSTTYKNMKTRKH